MSALLDDNSVNLTDLQHTAVKEMEEIMNEYPSINFPKDINFLTKYLWISDWNAEEAVKKIIYFYRLKNDHPEWFAGMKVSEYLPVIRKHTRYMLLDRDKNGRRIFVYKLENFHIPELSIKLSSQLDDIWFEAMLMDQATQRNGLSIIIDCKNTPKRIIQWLIPKDLKIAAEKTNIFPCKIMDVHLVNISTLLNIVTKAVTPFLNENIKSKFHFHQKDWASLHEFIGKECLPVEYGGFLSQVAQHDEFYKFLLDRENILLENMKYGIV